MKEFPLVSIIIPCYKEEKFIEKCLDSVLEQDYPKDKTEILVVDGMSKDKTRDMVKKYQEKYSFLRMLDNLQKFTPFALNTGINNSNGEVIIRLDAHSFYPKNYVSLCVKNLLESGADNVGGIWKILPKEGTLINKAIVLVSGSFFGGGNALYRIGYSKGIKEVDTVFGGCYRKEVFKRIGLYNENLKRSQDMEFNLRLKKSGGKIILVPEIFTYYYPKSKLSDFFVHNFEDGIWAVYPLKFVKISFKLRHYIPLIFVLTFPISIWPYIPASLFFSFKIALREKDWKLFFALPVVFFVRHFAYGVGSVIGIVKLILGK